MGINKRLYGLSTMLILLAVSGFPAMVAATPFVFQVDRFELTGTGPWNFVDDFDDGTLDPWDISGTAEETDGSVFLRSPGEILLGSPILPITREGSSITSPQVMSEGAGDFTGTSFWSPMVPSIDEFFLMFLDWADFASNGDQFGIFIGNPGSAIADRFGWPTGLIAGSYRLRSDAFGDVSFDWDIASLLPGDITGDILLRIAYDDSTDAFSSAYSLDGGGSFASPFSSLGATLPGHTQNGAWSMFGFRGTAIPEPASVLLLVTGVVCLGLGPRRGSAEGLPSLDTSG